MKHVALMATLTTLLVAGALPATAADSKAYWMRCGSQAQQGAGWYNVVAHNIGCRNARAVARRYGFDPSPYNFGCQSKRTGYESRRYFCRRDLGRVIQKVRFSYGS